MGTPPARVVVVGLGNIGSHLIGHLGRDRITEEIVLVDHDRYEQSNLWNQYLTADQVGMSKVDASRDRLLQINPTLTVETHMSDLEDIPWGILRHAIVLTCVDSRRARMAANLITRRLGLLWIDAGVADGGLVRVSTFPAGAHEPCLECSWDQRDYELVEQAYPCADSDQPAAGPATTTSAGIGGLAAAMQAVELARVRRLQADGPGRVDVVYDSEARAALTTSHRHNSNCRLGDHQAWPITDGCGRNTASTLRELVDAGVRQLSVSRSPMVTNLRCTGCHGERPTLRLASAIRNDAPPTCAQCADAMTAAGWDTCTGIDLQTLSTAQLALSLADTGLLTRDVVTTGFHSHVTHWEVL